MSKKKKVIKITITEPSKQDMPNNQFGAKTYGEWCEKEAERLGNGAYVYRYTRKINKNGRSYDFEFCRIEREG